MPAFNARRWRTDIYYEVEQMVDDGLDRLAGEVVRLAKSRAPVRKNRLFQRRNKRPTNLLFTDATTGKRVSQKALQQRLSFLATRSASRRLFGGDTPPKHPSASTREHFNEFTQRAHTALLKEDPSSVFSKAFVVPHLPKSANAPGNARDVALGRGFTYNERTETFQYGGTLKRSIHKETVEHDGKKMSIQVVADAPYAWFVEFGTFKDRAQPFLYPSLEQVFPKASQFIGLPER